MGLREAVDAAAADAAHRTLSAAMLEVISAERAAPAGDLASWLVQHPARLSETELIHQMAILYATGAEPTWNLIAVTVLLPVTDERLGGELLGGALSTRDAIDEVLFSDPPATNSCVRYPVHDAGRTKRCLLEAALDEFAVKGYAGPGSATSPSGPASTSS
jgi:cytochrome P450